MGRVRAVMQAEAAECGLACLAMVGSAHGLHVPLVDLRQRFSVSLKGMTLAALSRHAEQLGFAARALRLKLHELGELRLPCVLHWDLNHFVVLTRVTRRHAHIVDPAVGQLKLPLDTLSARFTGIALELRPGIGFEPRALQRVPGVMALAGRVHGLRGRLAGIFGVALLLEGFALAAPLFQQFVVDRALRAGDASLLVALTATFALLLLMQTCLSLLRSWLLVRLAFDVRLQWLSGLFEHLLRLPAAFFEKRHLGDLASRFGSMQAMQATLTTALVGALIDGVMSVLTLACMLAYSVPLAGIVMASAGVYVAIRLACYSTLKGANGDRLVHAAREQSYFLETLRAIAPIKVGGLEPQRLYRWRQLAGTAFRHEADTQRLQLLFGAGAALTTGLGTVLFFAGGALGVMEGSITLGMLVAFSIYAATFSTGVTALVNFGIELKMLSLHAERIADITLAAPEPASPVSIDPRRLRPGIEVRNLGMRHGDGEPWVFRHLNFVVPAGTSAAIVGPSGCGKSTLLKVLLGVHEPTEGEVLIDGVPAKHVDRSSWRAQVSSVLQDDSLLAGSIADNIAFFATLPDMDRVQRAAEAAAIHDEIAAMPLGYQTPVSDMGHALSGGQRQRVLLARAFYRDPRVLVLDEATSHLDSSKEEAVMSYLIDHPATRIFVTHRPGLARAADQTIHLRQP